MKLQKVYIKNFRGIKEVFIDLQGKNNLLIGDNGCCKTTILEAVDLCFNGKLEQEDLYNLNLSADNNCIIACIFDENIKQDAGECESFNAIVHKTHIENGDEKISQSKYLFSFKLDITKDIPAIDLDDPSKSAGDKSMFSKIYENLQNDTEIKEILSNYDNKARTKTKNIFNDEKDGIKNVLKKYFEIENIDYEYNGRDGITPKINIVNRYGDKTSKDLSHSGSGIRKIIKFIARTKFDGQQKSIFLIDEPEQNLHPNFQSSLIKFLEDENIQCIFTSHSPTFVEHCMNSKNCEVLICERDENSKIMVKPIKEHIEKKEYGFLENHTNSQVVANFLAFGEYSTDLHNLLYGLLWEKDKATLENGKLIWHKQNKDGTFKEENNKSIHYIIRNLIHHPENTNEDNLKYKDQPENFKEYLKQSIDKMITLLKNNDDK